MNSDYKGKNIFGADIYQGSDGIYHSKEEADNTYRADYKRKDEHTPLGYNTTNDSSYRTQPAFTASASSGYYGMSERSKNRLTGIILSLGGSWIIPWLFVSLQRGYHIPGVVYHVVSFAALIFIWPGKVLSGFVATHALPGFSLFFLTVTLLNFIWVCALGKLLLKKGKFTHVFGWKTEKYKQVSWAKVGLLLIAVQLLVGLSAQI